MPAAWCYLALQRYIFTAEDAEGARADPKAERSVTSAVAVYDTAEFKLPCSSGVGVSPAGMKTVT